MAFIAFIAFAFTLTTFMAFIAFIAFAFTLTAFIAFIARRMPFFIGGASSTAFFIAFAMMKGEREIEGYGHELKNQLEPQEKKKVFPSITRSHALTTQSNPAYTTLAHNFISADQMGIHCWFSIHESVLNDKDSAASSGLRSTTMWTRPHPGARPMHQSLRASSLPFRSGGKTKS